MALNLIVAALERGPASPTDALVLIAICDSADKVSGEAWPSLRSLAQAARVTPRAVNKILLRLVSDGWIEIERRHRANGSQASNLYRVNLAQLGELRAPPEPRSAPPLNVVHPPPEPRSPSAPERGSPLEPSHQKEPRRGGRRAREIAGERKGKASAWSPKPAPSASASRAAPQADVLAFYADMVMRKAPGVSGAVSSTMARKLLAAGLVTQSDLRAASLPAV